MTLTKANERRLAAEVAAGKVPGDVALKGGKIVNVYTNRIYRADVLIAGNRIAAVGDVDYGIGPNTRLIDCTGLYLTPGLIDSHMHMGGSQLAVRNLAEVVVPHGTVAIATDFYEIGTIGGLNALKNEMRGAEGTGLDILGAAVHFAVLGVGKFGNPERFSYDDMQVIVEDPNTVELREWNCWANAIPFEGQARAYETALERRLKLGGHLEGLAGPLLQSSIALGVGSEHEAVSKAEALERIQHGVMVQIRGGSGARDFDDLVPAITEEAADPSLFAFCTDEQELTYIAKEGHIDRLVRQAVRNGIGPVDAVKMATLNAARSVGAEDDYGAIVPGRIASIVAVEELATFPIKKVISRGELVVENGEYLPKLSKHSYPEDARATVNVEKPITAGDFRFQVKDGEHSVRVIGVRHGDLKTEELVETVRVEDGELSGPQDGLAKISVIDRHDGGEKRSLGLIRGLNIQRGAIATTVNPGMMNLLTVGVNEADMALAASRVVELSGGIVVAVDGEVVAEVALPLYGIVSDAPTSSVIEACKEIDHAIESRMKSDFDGLLSIAGFSCLAVSIPTLKITDGGLVRVDRDGSKSDWVELFMK